MAPNNYKYLNTQLGDFDIIQFLGNKKYLGKCRKCGFEKTFNNSYFTAINVNTKGVCGCSKSGIQPGDRFGRLTVIKRDLETTDNDNSVFWLCQCDCGNIKSVISKHLKGGKVSSCGCYMREVHKKILNKASQEKAYDLTNQKFNMLTAIAPATIEELIIAQKPTNNNKRYWKCKCDCGNITYVSTSCLVGKTTYSCGCISSKGEYTIIQILLKNDIKFIQQYHFNDLKNIRVYRFDFGVLNEQNDLQYLIEYDGEQHFESTEYFTQSLKEIQYKDTLKNQYCLSHNIPLIRIPYTHLNSICLEDLIPETSQFLIKEEKKEIDD